MTDRERLAAILADVSPEIFAEQVTHGRDYWLARADKAIAQGVTLPEPPAPPAPPKPNWEPGKEARNMLCDWTTGANVMTSRDFLRRLYAQLHRDRVAALETYYTADAEDWVILKIGRVAHRVVSRADLLALADDGTGT